MPHFSFWLAGRFQIDLTRPQIMGILNLTPDSFSDGGSYRDPSAALRRAQAMIEQGADIIDVGAESTRPGASPLTDDEEWQRLKPVLQELVSWNFPISLDTYHPITMQRGLDLGVDIINDIWALRQPGALEKVLPYSCGLCLMHMSGEPTTMQTSPIERDALRQVLAFFSDLSNQLMDRGVDRRRWVIDPGIGFGKTAEQNFALLAHQAELLRLGQPILVGWSRKSALGYATGLPTADRLVPSIAAALLCIDRGARVLRVHDPLETRQAVQVWEAAKLAKGLD